MTTTTLAHIQHGDANRSSTTSTPAVAQWPSRSVDDDTASRCGVGLRVIADGRATSVDVCSTSAMSFRRSWVHKTRRCERRARLVGSDEMGDQDETRRCERHARLCRIGQGHSRGMAWGRDRMTLETSVMLVSTLLEREGLRRPMSAHWVRSWHVVLARCM
jgi:hypothetical protein